jgi:hypothetical protein
MEVLALRKEVEELKMKLFWAKYSNKKLRNKIRKASRLRPNLPLNCSCEECRRVLRFCAYGRSNTGNPDNVVCTWRPLFEAKLAELGILISDHQPYSDQLEHECATYFTYVTDQESHIVNILNLNMGECEDEMGDSHDWNIFTYGSKLFKATSTKDPELQKLVALFEWLDTREN